MPTEQTKTVRGFFKDQQITRAEFIKRWDSLVAEMTCLAESEAELKELDTFKATIQKMAGRAWDRLKK